MRLALFHRPKRGVHQMVHTYLDISTGHVGKAEMDAIQLDAEGPPVTANYEHGSFLYVVEADPIEDAMRRETYPGVQAILEFSRTLGVSIIRLDADAAVFAALKVYDWPEEDS